MYLKWNINVVVTCMHALLYYCVVSMKIYLLGVHTPLTGYDRYISVECCIFSLVELINSFLREQALISWAWPIMLMEGKTEVGAAISRDLVSSDLWVNLQLLGGLVLKFGIWYRARVPSTSVFITLRLVWKPPVEKQKNYKQRKTN